MYSKHVIKTINGRKHVFDEMMYRRRGQTRTTARYVGPLDEVQYEWRRRWS